MAILPPQTFPEVIALWDTGPDLARDIGRDDASGYKLVQAWRMRRSIPAEWFTAVADAARVKAQANPKFAPVTVELLARLAERNRLRKATSSQQDAAA